MSDREKFGLDAEIAAKMDGKYSVEREKEAIAWMEAVTGLTVEPDFIGGLKNGVILCTLMNIISPGAISKFAAKPKHYLEHKSNIDYFVGSCNKIGVPSSDMITSLDLSDSRPDKHQVLQCIYAVARQAQAIGYVGPRLGVTMYKSREEQLAIEKKRVEEAEKEARRQAQVEKDALARRLVAEEKKAKRNSAKFVQAREKIMKRRSNRESRPRERERKKAPGNFEEKERTPSPVKYGMDAETEDRILEEYEKKTEQEQAILDWIEEVTDYDLDDFSVNLQSGEVLCELANCIMPNTVLKIHRGNIRPMLARENISNFLAGAQSFGLGKNDIFQVNDLYQKQNLNVVLACLWTLATRVSTSAWYKGPKFVPKEKKPVDEVEEALEAIEEVFPDVFEVGGHVPQGYKAFAFMIWYLVLAFFAGYGNVMGAPNIRQTIELANIRASCNASKVVPACPDVNATSNLLLATASVDFFFLAAGAFLLDFAGPKVTSCLGLILKLAGMIMGIVTKFVAFGFPYYGVMYGLLAAGGPFVLVALIPIAQAFSNYSNWAIFLCVGFYLLGSSSISLAFREVTAMSTENGFYINIAFAAAYFLCLVLAAILVPVRKWHYEETDEKKVENQNLLDGEIMINANDTAKTTYCEAFKKTLNLQSVLFMLFVITVMVQCSFTWTNIPVAQGAHGANDNISKFIIPAIAFLSIFSGLLIDLSPDEIGTLIVIIIIPIAFLASCIYVFGSSEILDFVSSIALSVTFPLTFGVWLSRSTYWSWRSFGALISVPSVSIGVLIWVYFFVAPLLTVNLKWLNVAFMFIGALFGIYFIFEFFYFKIRGQKPYQSV